MSAIVTVTTELTQSQALALAQFVKRLTWSEIQACAVDENETYEMRDAVNLLQKSLAEAGFSPR
ncbi:TPA: hypothetical protein ACGD8A_004559 [Serratia marcescens]|jgi:hypothetical protein|uniref:Uncharacterized protein n=1 Tax=Serratia marcescens TaxID=615 RepID=A0A5C7BUN3_SERMA|nr:MULTISPECIES: hypothetical protein [Serratia]MBL0881096.1 hypothetical protein [Serratia ureilytica]MDN2473360.1 hypothetical protein [Serratia ureilytica]TXE27690.1 hypothetical protein FOT62_22075 [Serratia marcescens]TXE56273.1 hypothetical protein FOT56_24530 [Serratia marcescens]BAO36981.1 hypothetical protein SM39_pSMC2_12 [Serratia marcescens SM39]